MKAGVLPNGTKKGSMEMMEYIFLLLFLMVMIVGIIIFLAWWNVSQLGAEKTKMQTERTLVMSKALASSPFLARDESLLDDGKLTAFQLIADGCARLAKVYGSDWFATINMSDGKDSATCTPDNYPDCNYWVFCKRGASASNTTYVFPVNVYRNQGIVMSTGILGKTYVATMQVGVYTGG